VPKLSIIIPTFNSSGTIEGCLKSIGSQTFRDYEVVVRDGGSADDTLKRIGEFKESNAGIDIMVLSEKDEGPYDAMNKGVKRANGEWLYFLGSDDELHDENVLATIISRADLATCDVVYGNVKVTGDSGWAKNNAIYDGSFDLAKFLNRNICHQAIFYRTSFHKEIGEYNVRYTVCADWDFNMRCWTRTTFRHVDTIVAKFCAGGVSTSRSDDSFAREITANVLKYFDLSMYDPLVNRPTFAGFQEIVRMQKSRGRLQRAVGRICGAIGSVR
jgi:glycosyltransferase involved in cell wall biosynthesis